MAVKNPSPATSATDVRSKYAEYFVEDKSNTNLSIETFFTLLMAEMSNQDPLEPTSNTEFLAQLANFTALQNSSNTLYYNTVAYASSLAGKTVTVATSKPGRDGGLNIETGVVTGVDISDGTNIEITVNGKRYKLSNVMNVAESSSAGSYNNGSDGAYAVSLIGKKVTLVAETADGAILDQGIVESIEVENGEYRVVVNGYSYALSDIIKVNNADEKVTGDKDSGTKEEPKEEAPEDKTTETVSQNYSDMLYLNTVSYATSLTGKTVTLSVYDAATEQMKTISGVVSEVDISDRVNIGVFVDGKRYSLSAITGVADTVTRNSFSSDGAFAVSLIGKEVSILTQQGYSVNGVVESITMADGQYFVVVNGINYPLSSVTTVNGAYITPDEENVTPPAESDGADNDAADEVDGNTEGDEVTDTQEENQSEEG